MQKFRVVFCLFSLLQIAMISACTLPFVSRNLVNLQGIYNVIGPSENNTGNFLLTTDGTILFINPIDREKLRSIVSRKAERDHISCIIFNPTNYTQKAEQLDVKLSNNFLEIGNFKISESEMLRLRLTKDWAQVIENKRIFPADCSIVRLMSNKFLVTGGRSAVRNGTITEENSENSAMIYDSESNTVVKKFHLRQHRYHHLSLLLPNGKVLLIDGNYMEEFNPAIEVVDPSSGNTVLFKNVSKIPRTGASAYIDEFGNCVIVGGTSRGREYGTGVLPVECLNIQQEKFDKIGSTNIQRFFETYKLSDVPI